MVLGLLWTIIVIIVAIIIIIVLLKLVFAIIAIGPYAVYDAHQGVINANNLLRALTNTYRIGVTVVVFTTFFYLVVFTF